MIFEIVFRNPDIIDGVKAINMNLLNFIKKKLDIGGQHDNSKY